MSGSEIFSLSKLLGPWTNRIRAIVSRGITRLVDDSGNAQQVQAMIGPDVVGPLYDRVQDYGVTSNPPPGGEVLILNRAGLQELGLIAGTNDFRYRPRNLESGEVMMYTDLETTEPEFGQSIKFMRSFRIKAKSRFVLWLCRFFQIDAKVFITANTPGFFVGQSANNIATPILEGSIQNKTRLSVASPQLALLTGSLSIAAVNATDEIMSANSSSMTIKKDTHITKDLLVDGNLVVIGGITCQNLTVIGNITCVDLDATGTVNAVGGMLKNGSPYDFP